MSYTRPRVLRKAANGPRTWTMNAPPKHNRRPSGRSCLHPSYVAAFVTMISCTSLTYFLTAHDEDMSTKTPAMADKLSIKRFVRRATPSVWDGKWCAAYSSTGRAWLIDNSNVKRARSFSYNGVTYQCGDMYVLLSPSSPSTAELARSVFS